MKSDLSADRMHALALQLIQLGQAGHDLPADVTALVGDALRHFANSARRMERALDDIVLDAAERERLEHATRRRAAMIREIYAGARYFIEPTGGSTDAE